MATQSGQLPTTRRGRLRRVGTFVLAAAIALPVIGAVGPSNIVGATTTVTGDIVVTGTADGTGSCTAVTPATTPATTNCTTLRGAINRANVSTGAPVTITVPAGTYNLSSGTLVISRAGTKILGAASPVTPTLINGGNRRAFEIRGATVTIAGVTITNGNAGLLSSGGAIRVNSTAGGFILSESTISNNRGQFGGGIEAIGSTLIERSTFVGNTASFKGGAIRSNGTLEVVNSTFTNNSGAERGGAISVYGSLGKGAISYSTFVDNVSAGVKGGGVDRFSGTLSVTGSILTATVNPTTGKDCNNAVNLVGANFVGNAAGCSGAAPLTATTPGPVALGPLADNGGATQTFAPLAGSVAIDAGITECKIVAPGTGSLGGSLTVDQRGLTRPSGLLGSSPECDLGAVEIVPLDVELALRSSTETPLVGASTIPAANIPSAVSETQALFGSTLNASPLRAFPLAAAPLRAFPLRAFPLRAFPLRAFFTAAAPLRAFDVEAFPLRAFPFDSVPLSDLVLVTVGGWTPILTGTPFADVPLQSLTLSDLQSYANGLPVGDSKRIAIEGVQFADLNLEGTPLRAFPTVAFLLSSFPLRAFPLRAFDGAPTGDWCELFPDFCTEFGVTHSKDLPADVTLASAVLAGESLDSLDLTASPLGTFLDAPEAGSLESFPLRAFPLRAFELLNSPLRAFPLRAFPLRAFDVNDPDAIFDCASVGGCTQDFIANGTMEDVAFLDVNLEKLINLVATDDALRAAFDAYGLSDLLIGFIPPTAVPWEQLDLTVPGLQNAAEPPVTPFQYIADITLSAPAATATVQVVLPQGFAYVPGGSKRGADPIGDPVLSLSTGEVGECTDEAGRVVLTFGLTNLAPGTTSLSVDVRAGLTLGAADANACVVATGGGQTADANAGTLVTVVEPPATPTSPIRSLATTNNTNGDGVDVNLGYVTGDGNVDLYSFEVSQGDAILGIQGDLFLSNLPADYDLVLYGKKTDPLRNPSNDSIGFLDDVLFDLNPFDDQVQADTVQDVPQQLPAALVPATADYVPVAISSNRALANEQIQTGTLREGTYYVQVSAYNGALSNDPFALRFQTTTSTPPPPCAALTPPTGAFGALPDLDSVDDNVNTLFLVNEQLLEYTYGATEAASVIAAAQAVADADELGVIGQIIPVDGDPDVQTAYADRFAEPCDPILANDVVRAIGDVIDVYTTEFSGIENIVIIGDDRQIPMANIVDDANYSNERTFASGFTGNNESISALVAGMYRTDDPYGTDAGIRVRDHELFVPERAVGRLVESPAEIIRSLENFVDPDFAGRLDPDTTANALQTGYEFLEDGAELNAANLEADDVYDVDRVFGPDWTATTLADELEARQYDVIGIHAHFDENNALPAKDNFNPKQPGDLFSSSEFVNNRSIVYSMGCHAGYSRSDIQVGVPAPDWAQRTTGELDNVFAGNTGYGYGDSDKIALAELLTADFAAEIAEGGSIGRAWVDAKQRMLADVHVLDAYQEKTLQQFVFYGLPMFHVGSAPPDLSGVGGAVTNLAGSIARQSGATSSIVLSNEPRTGLQVGKVVSTPTLNSIDVPGDGTYYTAEGGTIDVNGRPIQPLFTTDITSPNPALEARDVLITGLQSRDEGVPTTPGSAPSFDPVFFKAASDFDQPRPEFFDGSFPAELSTVRSFQADGRDQQQLLLAVGQFRGSQETPNLGVQRLHTRVETQVYYGQPNPSDITAPSIDRSRGFIDDGVAFFEVSASDAGNVKRVYILFRGTTGANWTGLDLAKGSDGVWRGGRGFSGGEIEFAVQAVDSSGNVAMSNSKSLFFLDADPVAPSFLTLVPTPATGVFTEPWYTGDVNVAINGATPGTAPRYSIDGSDFLDYTDPILVTGNGGHVVTALDPVTGVVAELYVAIDSEAPTASIPVPVGFVQGPVTVTATFDDGDGAGVKKIDATVNGFPRPTETFPVAERRGEFTIEITDEGVSTVDFVATDDAGNVTGKQTVFVSIDNTKPNVTVSKDPTSDFTNGPVTVGVVRTDTGGSDVVERWYTVVGDTSAPGGTARQRPLTEQVTAEGVTRVIGFAQDAAGNIGQSAELTINIDTVKPVVTTVSKTPGAEFTTGPVTVGVVATDTGGSGVGRYWYTVVGDTSAPGGTARQRPLTEQVTVEGVTRVIGFAQDAAGNIGQSAELPINIDKTPPAPTLSLSSTSVPVGGSVIATFQCPDPVSPIPPAVNGVSSSVAPASCVLSVTNTAGTVVPLNVNGTLPTATAGTYTATVTATDVAGNVAVPVSATYTVVAPPPPSYTVCQLGYNPNQAKNVGSAFAITLRLCNSAGVNVSSSSIVLVATVINPGGFEAVSSAPGGSNPSKEFVFANGSYTFNLKTNGLPPTNLTLAFVIKGDTSGAVYTAPFKLK